MIKSRELIHIDMTKWRKLANAFYSLAHRDEAEWRQLPEELKNSDVGKLCEEYLETKDWKLLEKAGQLLAGKDWYVALGR